MVVYGQKYLDTQSRGVLNVDLISKPIFKDYMLSLHAIVYNIKKWFSTYFWSFTLHILMYTVL